MLSLLATIALSKSIDYDVAYSARYYFQGKRKSYEHLYVCRHDGTHRKQLTFDQRSITDLLWIDRKHLALVECGKGFEVPAGEGSWQSHDRIVLINVETGQRKILFAATAGWCSVDQASKTIYLGRNGYQVSLKGLKKSPIQYDSDKDEFGKRSGDREEPDIDAELPAGNKSAPYHLSWKEGDMPQGSVGAFDLKVSRGQEKKSFTLQATTVGWAIPGDPSHLFVMTEHSFRRFYCGSFLYDIDYSKGTSKELVSGAGGIHIDRLRHLWLGTQTEGRPLEKLKDGRQVWVGSLYGGNWKTGKRWTIADGLVQVTDYQLKPSR